MVGVHVEAGSALADVERAPREVAARVRLRAINYFGVGIGFVHGGNKGFEQAPIIFGIAPGIPVADIFLIPERPITYAAAEVRHHELDVTDEGFDLFRRFRRPEDRVEAAVIVVEGAGLGKDGVRNLSRWRGVQGIAVEQLHLNLNAVIHE